VAQPGAVLEVADGRRVVVDLDGASFTDTWLRTVQAVNKADQRLGLLLQDNTS
jgi:hypothetical protein